MESMTSKTSIDSLLEADSSGFVTVKPTRIKPLPARPEFKLKLIWEFDTKLHEIEKYVILYTLKRFNWHRRMAASSLGISYKKMMYKLSNI